MTRFPHYPAPVPSLISIDGISVLNGPGGVTGVSSNWITPGWRHARSTDQQDPWEGLQEIPGTDSHGLLPVNTELGSDGGLKIAGLEWMGARAYDPGARGFVSVDPLAPNDRGRVVRESLFVCG